MRITLFAFAFSLLASSFACAQGRIFLNDGSMATVERPSAISPEMSSVCSGIVVDENGDPIDGVTVAACQDLLVPSVFGIQSKKGGKFDLRVRKGRYVLEFMASGYDKVRVEADLTDDRRDLGKVVMRRSEGGKFEIGGDTFKFMRNYYLLSLKPHPLHEGKTLADVLEALPFVELFSEPQNVMFNEMYELNIDGQAVRVKPEVLKGYLASIAAEDVKSVKVVAGRRAPVADVYPATPAVVSVTTR